jgi:hypothetical protein
LAIVTLTLSPTPTGKSSSNYGRKGMYQSAEVQREDSEGKLNKKSDLHHAWTMSSHGPRHTRHQQQQQQQQQQQKQTNDDNNKLNDESQRTSPQSTTAAAAATLSSKECSNDGSRNSSSSSRGK